MSDLSESLEDYLESILILQQGMKVVRVKDLMGHLGYKVSSVNAAIKNLAARGLVAHEKYGHVELTDDGRAIAEQIYARHENIHHFFHAVLGVDSATARIDACKIEHFLSCETYTRFSGFIKFIEETLPAGDIKDGIEKYMAGFKQQCTD